MPGILPSPTNASHTMFEPTSPSSSSDSFVREIKERAQEAVQKEAKGASAMALLKTVRNQYLMAKELEMQGELEDALSALTKTASLANMIFGTAEFESEKAGKGGVLRREFISFLEKDGADLSKRTAAVEERLRAIEKERQKSQPTPSSPDTISKPGGSIADRMKALQSNGLSISTSKRISTQAQNIPSPSKPSADFSPSSPRISSSPSARPSPIALPAAPLSPLSAAPSISSLTSALNGTSISASSPSPHSFVSPSTFGPPSPSSSPSSSPKTSNYTLSEFNSHFPSIDELDEDPNFALPSVPTGLSTTSNKSSSSRSSKTGADAPLASPTPHAALRNFIVPMERPSSTPITPTNNLFNSRPASPSKPPVPLKPSNLSTSSSSASAVAHGDANHHVHPISQSPSYSNGVLSKPSIPKKNTATPRELKEYVRGYKVLLLDVRNRADFDKEHIKAPGAAVVCVEPTVLMRSNVTGESLEDSMVIAPAQEATAFKNRDKWDLVVVYDQKSIDFGGLDSLLNVLIGAISERAFKKPLRRMPMILVGGLDAWKAEMGLQEVEVSGTSGSGYSDGITSASASASTTSHAQNGLASSPSIVASRSTQGRNPFANGGPLAVAPPSPSSKSYPIPGSASISSATAGPNTEYWTPPLSSSSSSSTVTATTRTRSETNPSSSRYSHGEHRGNYSVDQRSIHSRSPADSGYSSRFGSSPDSSLSRRPAISRAALSSTTLAQPIAENAASPSTNGASSITYPSFSRSSTSGIPSTSSTPFTSSTRFDIASPPQASISPSLSRRRSDYIDQSQEAVSGLQNRPIDYPELSTQVIRPPPAVASPALERQDNRPRLPSYSTSSTSQGQLKAPTPPRIESYWPVTYWADSRIGISGLRNLGNTCYMNAPIQCLSASPPFARFFNEGRWKSAINFTNTLGSKGKLTGAFAKLVHAMWANEIPHQTPHDFKHTICSLNSQYVGTDQHDSQEFLSFLLDGIHEDLNRVVVRQPWTKTPEEEAELEKLPPQIASEQEWRAWKARNDSVIVDYFQGQFRNQMKCLTCNKTSTTYNTFSILSVPIPSGRSGKMPLQRCLDAFFNTEVMEKDDAWDCPQCKQKQRASKQLSLARLPPILVIHLKRFEANGRFSDKIDTFVDFPLKSLDFTSYMPPPLPAGADHGRLNGGVPMSPDDPRSQMPPYKYDLYGVTNHTGNLSSGHYTAYVASGGGWKYCDDSTIKDVDHKQVVSQKAYVLFYKRTKA